MVREFRSTTPAPRPPEKQARSKKLDAIAAALLASTAMADGPLPMTKRPIPGMRWVPEALFGRYSADFVSNQLNGFHQYTGRAKRVVAVERSSDNHLLSQSPICGEGGPVEASPEYKRIPWYAVLLQFSSLSRLNTT